MEVYFSNRGGSQKLIRNSSDTKLELQIHDSTSTPQAAVKIDFSSNTNTNKPIIQLSSSDTIELPLDPEVLEVHAKNKNILSSLETRVDRKYLDLISSVAEDRVRLQQFIKGVSEVLRTLDSSPNSTGAFPLVIGKTLAFSADDHLEAAYAASANGEVKVNRYAFDLNPKTAALNDTPNEGDPVLPEPRAEVVSTYSSEGYKKNPEDYSKLEIFV